MDFTSRIEKKQNFPMELASITHYELNWPAATELVFGVLWLCNMFLFEWIENRPNRPDNFYNKHFDLWLLLFMFRLTYAIFLLFFYGASCWILEMGRCRNCHIRYFTALLTGHTFAAVAFRLLISPNPCGTIKWYSVFCVLASMPHQIRKVIKQHKHFHSGGHIKQCTIDLILHILLFYIIAVGMPRKDFTECNQIFSFSHKPWN